MPEFQPDLVEQMQRGATAGLLLEAQTRLIGLCIKEVITKIDQTVTNNRLTADLAVGLCHEIAAFQRILNRHQQEVDVGRSARRRLEEANGSR